MVTLQAAARSLADNLGGFGLFRCTEAADPTDPDARRTLISTELVDDDRDPTSFNDMTVFASDGALYGQQLALRRDQYDGAGGRLYTSGQFSSIPQLGQEIEYHARLPRQRHLGEPGLREIINQALDRLWFPDDLALASTGATTYPAPAWLTSDRQIVAVKEGSPMLGVNPMPSGRTARLVHRAGPGTVLELSSAVATASTFYVVARRPYSTWIKAGGTWGPSTAGLVDDDDETLADPEHLQVVATWLAYRALTRRAPDFEQGAWRRLEAEWEQKASAFLQWSSSTATGLGMTPPGAGTAWSKGWSP